MQPLRKSSPASQLSISLARNITEVRLAQRLRHDVFATELGAAVPGRDQGIDCDIFDAYCDHLIVREGDRGAVVGTYRLLTGPQADRAGGFRSDEEFNLGSFDEFRHEIVEAGRACIHRDYRNGTVLTMLWAGIISYMRHHRFHYLIGCASIPLADGGETAAAAVDTLSRTSMSPLHYRVRPRLAASLPAAPQEAKPLPPLLRGYQKLGAYVCGAPAWDPDFGSADLLMLLPMDKLNERFSKRFGQPARHMKLH